MTIDTIFAVFEDFNDRPDEPPPLAAEPEPLASAEIGEIRSAAWTEGYLTGRQNGGAPAGDRQLTAKLLTSVYELSGKTVEAVDVASLAVADLLVNTVIAVTSDGWPARLLDRVRMVTDRIKPAVTVAPEFLLRDGDGTVRQFGDISDLSRALEAGGGEDVTIRWQRGEATISRTALLEDLREAIIPLSAGRTSEQNAGKQT
jgi:hypothetical protein